MSKTIFTNAAIVLPDEVIHGSVTVEAGEITDISSGGTQAPGAHDLGGDYLMPGMVELHNARRLSSEGSAQYGFGSG